MIETRHIIIPSTAKTWEIIPIVLTPPILCPSGENEKHTRKNMLRARGRTTISLLKSCVHSLSGICQLSGLKWHIILLTPTYKKAVARISKTFHFASNLICSNRFGGIRNPIIPTYRQVHLYPGYQKIILSECTNVQKRYVAGIMAISIHFIHLDGFGHFHLRRTPTQAKRIGTNIENTGRSHLYVA